MHQMIKSFAAMAIDIFENPETVEKAKKQLEEQKM